MESVAKKLQQKGIRPSIQRTKVLQYLLNNKNHPTVDTIYQDILPEMPNLSRTTIYNTLKTLHENGLVAQLDFGEGSLRYDGDIMPHSHFFCKKCLKVFDLHFASEDIAEKTPGFTIQESRLYAFGICKECNET